jgi:RHS repeat-associated protein
MNGGLSPTNLYAVGPSGEQLDEVDENYDALHANVFLNGRVLATYSAEIDSNWHFSFDDWLGTRRVQQDAYQDTEGTFLSLPFGDNLTLTGNPGATEHQFTSKERDTESGLDYFGARHYGSSMGRFMSPDYSPVDDGPPDAIPFASVSNPQSLNGYAYVGNNPMTGTDPDGHDCIYLNDDDTLNHWQAGDCTSSTDSGYYVNGSVSTIYENSQNQVTGYSGTSYDSGNLMTGSFASSLPYGPLEGPANQAGLNLLGNTSATAGSFKGVAAFYGASGAIAGCIVGCPAAGAAALTAIRGLSPVATLSLPAGAKVAQMIARAGQFSGDPAGFLEYAKGLISEAQEAGQVAETNYGTVYRVGDTCLVVKDAVLTSFVTNAEAGRGIVTSYAANGGK